LQTRELQLQTLDLKGIKRINEFNKQYFFVTGDGNIYKAKKEDSVTTNQNAKKLVISSVDGEIQEGDKISFQHSYYCFACNFGVFVFRKE
jgi:hypothetical protein